jgi:hypothetical protein
MKNKKINTIRVSIVTALIIPMLIFAQTPTTGTWNGRVSSVNGTSIQFSADDGTGYTADVSNAKFMRRMGAGTDISFIGPGNEIQVQGTANGSNITATSVRDMSLVGGATFTATVRSISDSTFLIRIVNTGPVTVRVTNATAITRNGQPAQFSDIAVGSKVTVKGVWDTATNTVTATSVDIM